MPKKTGDTAVPKKVKVLNSTGHKKYKVDLKKKSKVELPQEQEIIEDTVVVLKVAHYSNTKIAKIVNISRGQVGEILKDDRVQKRIAVLAATLPQAAVNLIQNSMIEAVMWIVHVGRANLDHDHALVLKAADALLDRGGAPKVSRSERKDEGGESFLSGIGRGGSEDIFDKVRSLSPELQERAAGLYDALEEGLKKIMTEGGAHAEDIQD